MGAEELFSQASRLLEDGGEGMWVAAAVEHVARRQHLQAIDVSDLPWIEIDFPEDLEVARAHTWPAICASTTVGERTPAGHSPSDRN